MDEIEQDTKTFEELVPHGEESFMVLKAQLLVEHSLAQYVSTRVPSMAAEIQTRNSQYGQGLRLSYWHKLSACETKSNLHTAINFGPRLRNSILYVMISHITFIRTQTRSLAACKSSYKLSAVNVSVRAKT